MKSFFDDIARGFNSANPMPQNLVILPPLKTTLPPSKVKTISDRSFSFEHTPPVNSKPGFGTRVFNWIKDKLPKMPECSDGLNWIAGSPIGVKAVSKVGLVRAAVKRGIIGKNSTFTGMTEKYKAKLISLEKNSNLAKATDALVPKIAKEIKEKIIGVDTPEAEARAKAKGKKNGKFKGFRTFLEKEDAFFVEIIRGIAYKIVVNFVEHTKNTKKIDGEIGTEIVKEMIKLAFEDFDQVEEKFNQIENLTCRDTKKKLFEELFAPASEKFLKIALPNGKKDLELGGPLATAVWKVISTEMIPEILTDSIRLVKKTAPHHSNEDLEVLNRPGGAALKNVAKFIGEQSKKLAPEILDEKSFEIAEAFMEKFTDDPENHLNTIEWISQKIREFALSKDLVLDDVWGVSAKNIESIVLHALASFCKDSSGNLIPDAASKALAILNKFIEENKASIDRAYIDTETLPIKEKNKVRAALFKPLVLQFLKGAGLEENDLVNIVKDGALPAIFREFYQDMTHYNNNTSEFRERLIETLFDEKAYVSQNSDSVSKDLAQALKNPNEAKKLAHRRSGIESVVDDLSKACGALAKDVSKIAREFAENDQEEIVDLINNGIFDDYKLSDEEKSQFADGLHQFLGAQNENLDKAWTYGQTIIENVLFKVLATVAENNPVKGAKGRTKNKNETLAGNVIHRVLAILVEKIPDIDSQLHIINMSDKDEKTKKKEIYALFQPMAKDFLAMAGDHVEDVFPVPNFLKKSLKVKLETLLLPGIFNEVYRNLNGWRYQIPNTSEELENILGSSNGTHAVTTIANYIRDFVPYYMETNPEKISTLIMQGGNRYFSLLSKENRDSLGDVIKKNVHFLGTDSALKESSKAIGEFAHGMILKMFTGVIRNIDNKERGTDEHGIRNNNFLLTTGISIIKTVTSHVKTINKIPKEGRNYSAHIVPNDKMLQGFADANELHSALIKDLDPNATPEERRQQRLSAFFIPFAHNFLEISGMDNAEDFPVPAPLKQEMWKLFKGEILPQALMNIFEEALKPQNINELMLSVLGTLADEVDDFSKRIDDADDVQVSDPHQRELDAGLGEFVKEMLDLVPKFWMKNIFKIDKIKKMTSEKLGQVVRKKLDDKTLIGYLDAVLGNFSLKKPDADRGKTEAQLQIERQKKEKELHKQMTTYVSNQIKDTTKNFIKSKWSNFQKSFDDQVNRFLGNPGMAVKTFLDKIFRAIFIKGLGSIFNFLVFKSIWFFVDMKIASITKEGIKDAHMPIHENGVYKCCDTFMEIMKRRQIKQAQMKIPENN